MQTTLKPVPPSAATYCCTSCGSDQTQRASVIHSSGTSTVQSKSTGMAVGLTKGGLVPVLGSSKTSGVQQTQLAQQVGPPAKHPVAFLVLSPLWAGPLLGLVFGLIAGLATNAKVGWAVFFGTYVVLQVGCVLVALKAHRMNRDEWPGLYAAWERKWFCYRCGSTFEPQAGQRAAA